MPKRRSAPKSRAPAEITIRDLLSYRLHVVANAISRSAALRYRQLEVNLGEWRAIALLAADQPASLNELARSAGLDKAQMSRVVAGLIGRGLVLREHADAGGRAVSLTLTAQGEALYGTLIEAAAERNQAFRACLTPSELATLESALGKLHSVAKTLSQDAPATRPAKAKKA